MVKDTPSYFSLCNLGLILLVAVMYYVSAWAGLLLAYGNTNATPVWPPSGIAFAAIILFGYRIWPGILLGAFSINIIVFLSNQVDMSTAFLASIVISMGNTLSIAAGCFLLKKISEDITGFEKVKHVLLYSLVVLTMCLVSATIGATVICSEKIASWSEFPVVWFTWWLGDVSGLFIFLPLLLSWVSYFKTKWKWNRKIIGIVFLFITLFFFNQLIFTTISNYSLYIKPYFIFPLLLFAAFYFDERILTTGIALSATIAVFGTIKGFGPFASVSMNDSLLSVQVYVSTLSLTIITLKAIINEREKSQSTLQEAHQQLKVIAKERKEELEDSRKRIDAVFQSILKYTLLDFSQKISLGEKGDEIDAIAAGLNTLSEELNFYIQKLLESEEKFRLIIDNVKDYAIIMLDPGGHIVSWNKGAEHIKGYTAEEIIGKHVSVFYTPEEIERGEPEHNLKMALENGSYETESWRVRKDGSYFWADVILTALYDDLRNLKGFVKVTRDTSERKRMEEELVNSKNFLDSVIENLPNMVFVKDARDLKFVRFNKAGENLLGYSKKELLGKNDYDFFPKEEADFFTSKDRKVLENKELLDIPEEPIETKHKGRRMLETKKIPILDKDGTPLYLLGISNDITERKKMQEALRVSEEKFNKAFQLSPTGIAITNLESGKYIDVNESFLKIIGFERDEIIGHTSLEAKFIDPNDRKLLLDEIKKEGAIRAKEVPFIKKTGERGNLLLSTGLITINNQPHTLTIIYDITKRIHAEQELKQKSEELVRSNQELEQFAYVASHDLQEPLRMINSYVQLLANRYKDKLDADANDFIGFAIDGSNRMRVLIQSLLEYSRINRVKPFEKIDVNQTIKDVEHDIQNMITENKAVIKKDKLPDIMGDPVLIGQLFQNLIVNAIKFRGDRIPEITISGKKTNGEYLFSVKDNGIGIEKEYAEKIFVIFQRLHTKDKYPGTGIGLAICKKIVERHGGKIWIESNPGEGTTFYFTIAAK